MLRTSRSVRKEKEAELEKDRKVEPGYTFHLV